MRKVYISTSTDPCENLAMEEMLFNTISDEMEILFLWQNENTVVIGQNQNPWKECNLFSLNRIDGTLVRRKSGGGAVYHDLGNLNFTFLSKYRQDTVTENLALIISALEFYGIRADFQGRNDLLVEGAKISGNAYYVEDGTICHHGTLLVDVDFEKLSGLLTPSNKKLESKGVDSVRSRVANLSALNHNISVSSLKQILGRLYLKEESNKEVVQLSVCNDEKFSSMVSKYRSWEWNFGQSPSFDFEHHARYPWGEVRLEILSTNGYIEDLNVYTDAMDVSLAGEIKNRLLGIPFNPQTIESLLATQIPPPEPK